MIQCCPNGARPLGVAAATPSALAEECAAAVAAGAEDLHVHPRAQDGTESMAPAEVARTLRAIRRRLPGIAVGVTTGAWLEPSWQDRVARVRRWSELPDHASVNWHEDGADAVALELIRRRVRVDAGIYADTEGLDRLLASSWRHRVSRVLIEIGPDCSDPLRVADDLTRRCGTLSVPLLVHGEGATAWPVLDWARSRGFDVRIGLEDVLVGRSGTPADNAALIAAASTPPS